MHGIGEGDRLQQEEGFNSQVKQLRTWDVLLIGGASGSGKTSISHQIARHYGVGSVVEVDDFQVMLRAMTTPEQQPAIHFWQTHPDPASLTPERLVETLIAIGEAMRPGLEAVIENHLDSKVPIVLEGDFILPALVAQAQSCRTSNNSGRVKGIFVIESDEEQLKHNYLLREPEEGEQLKRAQTSRLYNEWLAKQAAEVGVPTVTARPWEDVLERVVKVLE